MKLWLYLALLLVFSAIVSSQGPAGHTPAGHGPAGHGPHSGEGPHDRPPTSYEPTHDRPAPPTNPQRPPINPERPPTSYEPTHVPIHESSQDSSSDSSSQDIIIDPIYPTDVPIEDSSSYDSEDIIVCTMMMLQCPDGKYATQNSQCEYICGASPVGGLTWSQVDRVRSQFATAYGSSVISSTMVGTLNNKQVKIQSPPESFDDYCVEVVLVDSSSRFTMPAVYHGVRVIYVDGPACSPINCGNGVLVGCNEVCPPTEQDNVEEGIMLWPITIIFLIVLLSACCCLRSRRNKKCKKTLDTVYPAQQYELVHQQELVPEEVAVPMYAPQQMMMYPPMPMMMPPHMMMPNGGVPYPMMMQAPNGMWYSVTPQPESL